MIGRLGLALVLALVLFLATGGSGGDVHETQPGSEAYDETLASVLNRLDAIEALLGLQMHVPPMRAARPRRQPAPPRISTTAPPHAEKPQSHEGVTLMIHRAPEPPPPGPTNFAGPPRPASTSCNGCPSIPAWEIRRGVDPQAP